ncbi:MAG: two-component system response regulator [Maritimibacter sp.]|nr:two-component system response regulator [Maritimibacter sp.]
MPPHLIAIVDDDPGVRSSLHSLLRSAGMDGIGFASAEELLAHEDAGQIDCILTDLHMPGMSGTDLQEELARRAWARPVIVMTAYPTDAARARALKAGAHRFLTKPVDPDLMLDAIVAAVG